MRILSMNMREAIFAQNSDEVAVFLLTITHPALATPIRLSSDATQRLSDDPLVYGTISRGEEYLFVGMDITLPDEKDKAPPSSRLVISNVNRELVPLARSISTPAKVKIETILASAPDNVEVTVPALDMVSLVYDASELTFDLTMDALSSEPYPAGSFTPADFPGLFG